MTLRVFDLFSGIGGFSLGLEKAGMQTVAFCESDANCREWLRFHWPAIPVYDDVRTLCRRIYDCDGEDEEGNVQCPIHKQEFGECPCVGTDQFLDEIGPPDVITAGFPCQPFSVAGKRRGESDERNLWPDTCRVIRELGPRFVILENVPGLVSTMLDQVLSDLEAQDYSCWPFLVPASAYGAEHNRERLWIVANAKSKRMERMRSKGEQISYALAHPFLPVRNSYGKWEIEPDLRRADDGIPGWMDRLKAVGNAVVPQIPEIIGRAILEAERVIR